MSGDGTSRNIGGVLYRGLDNYQYFFGGSLFQLQYNGPQNPILIIKAPVFHVGCPVVAKPMIAT